MDLWIKVKDLDIMKLQTEVENHWKYKLNGKDYYKKKKYSFMHL